jgi:hypothetical protein
MIDSRLHFKHVYGPTPHEWGYVGFPSSQRPEGAIRCVKDDLVLMAVTLDSPFHSGDVNDFAGQIFGVCTLFPDDVASSELANPVLARKLPQIVERWKRGAPLREFAKVSPPLRYGEIRGLTDKVRPAQGKLFRLDEDQEEQVWRWLLSSKVTTCEIYRSETAMRILENQKRLRKQRPTIDDIVAGKKTAHLKLQIDD